MRGPRKGTNRILNASGGREECRPYLTISLSALYKSYLQMPANLQPIGSIIAPLLQHAQGVPEDHNPYQPGSTDIISDIDIDTHIGVTSG